MVSNETTNLILRHAGLGEFDAMDAETISGMTAVREVSDHLLAQAMSEFFQALVVLNKEMNGDLPSESLDRADQVPREVAYGVAEVERMLRAANRAGDADRVEAAWVAVLAGDIDDLEAGI